MVKSKKAMSTNDLVMYAVLTAIVVVLQMFGGALKVGMFNLNTALVPIVIGSAILGWKAGAWLGFVSALTILFSGQAYDFWIVSILGTIITVIAKGVLSGLAAGVVYNSLKSKGTLIATSVSAIVCPVVNTGVFILGCLVFFMPTIISWASGNNQELIFFMVFGLGLINFVAEILMNIILTPAIVRLLKIKSIN